MIARLAKSRQGFSLIELMMVLVLVGLASLITIPAIDRGIKKRQARQSILAIAAVARDMRRRAIDEGKLKELIISPREDSYFASGTDIFHLPQTVKVTGIAGGEPLGNQITRFTFFPNGSIVGGAIELSDRQQYTYLIRLEPLVGRVVVTRQ
ncbi:MAG TPA: type II secretion system protein [Candidatus Binatia bacterium]